MTTITTTPAKVPTTTTTLEQRKAGEALATALRGLGKAEGTVADRALSALTVGGYVTGGAFKPEGLPSLRSYAVAITPRTGQPKGTTWVLPSGDARKAAVNAGGPYAEWLKRVEAIRGAMQTAANLLQGKRRAPRTTTPKPAPKPETVTVTAPPKPEAVAEAAEAMLASIAAGKRPKGMSPERAATVRAVAAKIAPAAPAPTSAPVSVAALVSLLQQATQQGPSEAIARACADYLRAHGDASPGAILPKGTVIGTVAL